MVLVLPTKAKQGGMAMFDMCILTCMLVATRITRVAVLPNLPPHPHPILNLQSTKSEKINCFTSLTDSPNPDMTHSGPESRRSV